MENKEYVVQWGHNDMWQDAHKPGTYEPYHVLKYAHLSQAQEALDNIRNLSLQWRIILRIEIVLD